MDDEDTDLDQGQLDMFSEPEGYFKPRKLHTYETFALDDGREISLRLVGETPLWAHHLWNGAKILAGYLQRNSSTLVQCRTILELGAGAGLPSLTSAILGAANVVVTDYPDPELIENLQYNITECSHLSSTKHERKALNIAAMPYLWGAPVDELLLKNELAFAGSAEGSAKHRCFNVLLLADLLFNHSEHQKLVHTVRMTLARKSDSRALVFFTPYRPWLLDRDLAFFNLIQNSHLLDDSEHSVNDDVHSQDKPALGVHKILEETMDKVMFENDRGDELLRRTVYGYEIFWADLQS